MVLTGNGSNNRYSRRSLLKGAGGAFITFGAVGTGRTQTRDTVDIVVERNQIEKVTKSVPRTWHEYEEQVEIAAETARANYSHREEIQGISVVPSDQQRGGKTVNKLRFHVWERPGQALDEVTPDKVTTADGIEIPAETTAASMGGPDAGCHNWGSYGNNLYGGISVWGSNFFGTTACRVRRYGSEYFLTNNHLWDPKNSCNDNTYEDVYQEGTLVGRIRYYNRYQDWVLIEPMNNATFHDDILESGDIPHKVAGYYTYKGLKDMMDDRTTIHKQGVSTGNESGRILGVQQPLAFNCTDLGHGGIYTTCVSAGGDSGGPIYSRSGFGPDGVSMVSYHVGHLNKDDSGRSACNRANPDGENILYSRSIGFPAYQLEKHFDINFGPPVDPITG